MTEDPRRRRGGGLGRAAGQATVDVAAWCVAGVPVSIA